MQTQLNYPRNTGLTIFVSAEHITICLLTSVYRIDGKLVGISVVDILPLCVSSVYFIWDPEYAWASLGKISALREVALARDIREAGAKDMGWVYMGMSNQPQVADHRILDTWMREDGL